MKKTMLVLLVLGALSSVMAQNDGEIRLPILDYGNPQFPGIELQLPVLTQPDNYQPPVNPVVHPPTYPETQCVGGWGKDIVKNGGFEVNDCNAYWCIFNTYSLKANSALNPVRHWIQSPEIEVGRGYAYNAKLGTSWVSELDPKANTCIKQKVPIQAGRALLEFDWAGRTGTNAASASFEVRFNGQVLKTFTPCNGNVYQEDI
jgi:hypothetical protein